MTFRMTLRITFRLTYTYCIQEGFQWGLQGDFEGDFKGLLSCGHSLTSCCQIIRESYFFSFIAHSSQLKSDANDPRINDFNTFLLQRWRGRDCGNPEANTARSGKHWGWSTGRRGGGGCTGGSAPSLSGRSLTLPSWWRPTSWPCTCSGRRSIRTCISDLPVTHHVPHNTDLYTAAQI